MTRHTGEFQLQPPEIEFPSILRSKRNTHPGSNLLKPTEKIYLDNSNIYKAMSDELGFNDNTGTVREIFFIKMLQNANENIYYSRTGDFQVNDTIFEIGGKNKTAKQIKDQMYRSFLIKDNLYYPDAHTIPLHLFGFLY